MKSKKVNNYVVLEGYDGIKLKISAYNIQKALGVKCIGSFLLNYTYDDTDYLIPYGIMI